MNVIVVEIVQITKSIKNTLCSTQNVICVVEMQKANFFSLSFAYLAHIEKFKTNLTSFEIIRKFHIKRELKLRFLV